MSAARPDWDHLRTDLDGTLALPADTAYTEATPFVLSAQFSPAAVLVAGSADDVVRAMRWAPGNGLRVAVQRTGHQATHIGDDVLLIDTRRLSDVHVDPATRRATIGAGCLWTDLIPAASEHGLLAVSGSAPGVSAVGFLVGGGIGPTSRTFGLGSDWVRAFTVVTGDGELRRASADDEPDLFWGLRGGKATLGIVVSAEIELVEARTFFGGSMFFAGDDIAPAVRAWAQWADGLPEQGNTSLALMQLPPDAPAPKPITGRMVASVRFVWLGDEADGRRHAETIAGFGTAVFGGFDTSPVAELGAVSADPSDPMPFRDEGVLLSAFPPEAVDALLDEVGPESGSTLALVELRLMGARIGVEPTPPDAFSGRVGEWSVWLGAVPLPRPEPVLEHMQAVLAALQPWSTGRSMPNFLVSDDPADMPRLWAPQTYARLQELAQRYDPHSLLTVGTTVARST